MEIEATCCLKQLRHYACCWPATLRGRRVQAVDGELAVEPKSTSGTCSVDLLFLESADGLEFLLKKKKSLPSTKKIIQKMEPRGILTFPCGNFFCRFSPSAASRHLEPVWK